MEHFSKIELKEKLGIEPESMNEEHEGKIIFDLEKQLLQLEDVHEQHKRISDIKSDLKTVERLFGLVLIVPKLEYKNSKFRNSGGKEFLTNLFNTVKDSMELAANNLRWAEYVSKVFFV